MEKNNKPLPSHLNDFLDWLDIEKGLSSKSQENYTRFIKKFFDWLKQSNLNELKPHELTPKHIWDYRVYLSRGCLTKQNKPLKKSTQNYYLIALRSLLSFFSQRGIPCLTPEKIKLVRNKEGEHLLSFFFIFMFFGFLGILS